MNTIAFSTISFHAYELVVQQYNVHACVMMVIVRSECIVYKVALPSITYPFVYKELDS